MAFKENPNAEDIYKALEDGSLYQADEATLRRYLQATYKFQQSFATIETLRFQRQTILQLIQARESAAAHIELRGDNRYLIRLGVATLIIAALTLAATIFLPGGCAALKPDAPAIHLPVATATSPPPATNLAK